MAEKNARKRKEETRIDPAPLFPPASDRTAWLNVLKIPRNRKQSAEILKTARSLLAQPVPVVSASLFMEFTRDGNRSHYEAGYFARRANLNALVLAEVFEYKGKFLDAIIDYLWEITSEHTWCLPAHCPKTGDPLPEPPTNIVDLFAAETGMTLAQVLNLLEPELAKVSPNLVRTVRENMLRRVVDPILIEPFPFWWLVGRNNWTPWCCSNSLATALCVLKDQPDKLRKAVSVLKTGIDRYIEQYPADGGCIEGPSYWGKSPGILLFWMEQLRSWSRSPKIGPMAEYIVDACLTPTCYAAFGDCPPRIALPRQAKDPAVTRSGKVRAYQWWPVAPWICCRYGERIGNENLISMGLKSAQDYPTGTLLRDLLAAQAFFFWVPARRAGAIRKKPVSFYPESQLLFLNESGVALAAKRGWECSHHHSDVGQVILFYRDEPVLIDLGNTEYRRETFSAKRWEKWQLNSEGHNIPQFNGVRQLNGTPALPDSMSFTENADGSVCRMDLSNSYPDEAGVISCIRELVWNRREKTLEIRDSWKLKKRSGNTVRIPYYSSAPVVCRRGKWKIGGAGVRLENCSGAVTKVPLDDSVQVINWGKTVNRFEVTAGSGTSGSCSIFFEFKYKTKNKKEGKK